MNKLGSKTVVYLSKSTCIYENLAFEQWLFQNHNLNSENEAVLVWRNTPSVVIGRYQNPWLETDVDYLRTHNINLARRYSGGGTVYHDLGNINISLLTTHKRHCRPRNLANISSWLNASFKTHIELNQRDDLLLQPGDRKISGTAARISRGLAYHHLTLLVRPNLVLLRRALRSPFVDRIKTNATRSVQAKAVGQLVDVVPDLEVGSVVDVLLNGFRELANNIEVVSVDGDEINDEDRWNGINKICLELRSSEWIYGKSPKFAIELSNSTGQSGDVVVEQGRVVESKNDLYEVGSLFDKIKCM